MIQKNDKSNQSWSRQRFKVGKNAFISLSGFVSCHARTGSGQMGCTVFNHLIHRHVWREPPVVVTIVAIVRVCRAVGVLAVNRIPVCHWHTAWLAICFFHLFPFVSQVDSVNYQTPASDDCRVVGTSPFALPVFITYFPVIPLFSAFSWIDRTHSL